MYNNYEERIELLNKQLVSEYKRAEELQERIDKALDLEEEIMYLANKTAITIQNVEVKAIEYKLENIYKILKGRKQ